MSIVLNQFTDGVLTTAELNALVDAITAKFNSGITTGDLASPLRLPGNLDMNHFEILHLAQLWNIYNLAERSSSTTLQNVLDEVNTAGGGIVLLPADSTESVGTGGVTIGANTVFIGGGDSSVMSVTGTATNHMLRNKANGNSGIVFMNMTITGPTAGDFNAVAFTRTVGAKFMDVTFNVAQASGVGLLTDSAGSSCTDSKLVRCTFNLTSSADEGVFMQDVQRLTIDDCTFNSSVNGAISVLFTASGATSNCESVDVFNNRFRHTSGTTQVSLRVSAGATNGIDQLSVEDNKFRGVSTTNDYFVDIDGGTSTIASHVKIVDNTIKSGATNLAGIRVRNLNKFDICDNNITLSGNAIGVLVGATARAGSAATCNGYLVSDNYAIVSNESAFVFCHPGSNTIGAGVHCNWGTTALSATVATYEIWNLAAHPTTLDFDMQITHNMEDNGGVSLASWACYTDRGSTRGGRAGNSATSNLIVVGNQMTGTVFDDAAAGADFKETSTALYIQNLNLDPS